MKIPDLNELIADLQAAKQIAIEERKPTAMIQATARMAKLTGLDKPVIKAVYADSKPILFNIAGVSPDEAVQAYQDIMG